MDCYDSNRFTIEMKQNFTVEATKILDIYIDERVKSLLNSSCQKLNDKEKTDFDYWFYKNVKVMPTGYIYKDTEFTFIGIKNIYYKM